MNIKVLPNLQKSLFLLLLSFILISIFTLIVFSLPKAFAASNTDPAKILLTPDKASLKTGDTLIVTVNIDTASNDVNVYTVSLDYPQDKLEYVSTDASKSPFNMALEGKGGSGNVRITRGTPTAQKGKVLIGTVTFKAKTSVSADVVTVANDSAIVRSEDNTNILPGSTVQNTQKADSTPEAQQQMPVAPKGNFFSNILSKISSFFSNLFK